MSRLYRLVVVAGTALLCAAAPVLAQGGPPTLPAIELPIDETSVGTVIAAAIAGIMILVIGYKVGFKLISWLAGRMLGMKS